MSQGDRIFATIALCNAAVLVWGSFAHLATTPGDPTPAIYGRMCAVSATALLLTGLCYLLTMLWEADR